MTTRRATTRDGFLGGRVEVLQPARGFRSGSDAVLLAAACPARAGDSVLDLGCGAGVAMLCVAARVPGVVAEGVERDAATAALAEENGAVVTQADVTDLPPALRARSFDHVIANPPYLVPGAGQAAADPVREAALREGAAGDVAAWCAVACRRAGPRGSVTFIARADRLADLLGALSSRLGGMIVLPVTGRAGQAAGRIVVQGRKGARAPLRLLAPLIMHEGSYHPGDRDNHTAKAQQILRDAAPLDLNQ